MFITIQPGGTYTDQHGVETVATLLVVDGKTAAVIHSQDHSPRYNDDAIHQEHVIQGIEYYVQGAKSWDRSDVASYSAPTRSRMRIPVESADAEFPDVRQLVKEDYEETEGFYFVKWGAQGEELPANPSAAFMRGVKLGQDRTHRKIRSRKLTGKPSSW